MTSQLPPSESQFYQGLQQPGDGASEFNAIRFLVMSLLNQVWTAIPVQVKAVHDGGGALATAGTVDVQPLVNQVDGANNAVPHATIYGLPYLRLQGGANAVIIDPAVDDIGMAMFCHRDISKVVSTKAQANPGSRRRFSPSDAMYVGGLLNAQPTQYVRFSDDGIEVVSETAVTLRAPTITLDGDVSVTGTLDVDGVVTGDGVDLSTHEHSGVTAGIANTGPPV